MQRGIQNWLRTQYCDYLVLKQGGHGKPARCKKKMFRRSVTCFHKFRNHRNTQFILPMPMPMLLLASKQYELYICQINPKIPLHVAWGCKSIAADSKCLSYFFSEMYPMEFWSKMETIKVTVGKKANGKKNKNRNQIR